jgi:hypothetical protein
MKGAQIAVCDYAPAGWPPGTACVVRRVKIRAQDISTHPRARRRRTIPKGQLALALDGLVEHVYAYSFFATNLDVSTPAKAVAVEAWHRMRTDIEDRIRDAKHGAALRHLPSGSRAANTIWMWGAPVAVNLSAWLQELAGLDSCDGRGRAHLGTLRHRLLTVPGPAGPPRRSSHPAAAPRPPPAGPSPGPTPPAAYLDLTTQGPTGPKRPRRPRTRRHPGHRHTRRPNTTPPISHQQCSPTMPPLSADPGQNRTCGANRIRLKQA